jgi:hypothetical protein
MSRLAHAARMPPRENRQASSATPPPARENLPVCAGLISGMHRGCTASALRLHDLARIALIMHRGCIRAAWPMRRNADGITGMENISSEKQRQPGLPIVTDMINHRGQVGPKSVRSLEISSSRRSSESRRDHKAAVSGSVRHGVTARLLHAALEHPVKAFRLPSESHGQGLERAAVTGSAPRYAAESPARRIGQMTAGPIVGSCVMGHVPQGSLRSLRQTMP